MSSRVHRVTGALLLAMAASAIAVPVGDLREQRAESLYRAAVRVFNEGNWQLADAWLEWFLKEPSPGRLSKALLLRGQALFMQGKYQDCRTLLQNEMQQAGNRAGEFRFWMAESWLRSGNGQIAADLFAEISKSHPSLHRRAEAAISYAIALAHKNLWPQAKDALQPTESPFQVYQVENPQGTLVPIGNLVLAEAMLHVGGLEQDALKIILEMAGRPANPSLAQHYQLLHVQILARKPETRGEALAMLNRLKKETGPGQMAGVLKLRAEVLLASGDVKGALNSLSTLMQPGQPDIFLRRFAALESLRLALSDTSASSINLAHLEKALAETATDDNQAIAQYSLGALRLKLLPRDNLSDALAGTRETMLARAEGHFVSIKRPSHVSYASLGQGWVSWHREHYAVSGSNFLTASASLTQLGDKLMARFKSAEAFGRGGDQTNAIHQCRAILMDKPEDLLADRSRLLQTWAITRLADGELDDARAQSAFGLLGSITSPLMRIRAQLLVARLQERRGRPEKAQQVLDQLPEDVPDKTLKAVADLEKARPSLNTGNWKQAVKQYKQWLLDHNQTAPAKLVSKVEFDHAWLLAKDNQPDLALIEFARFAQLRPRHPQAPQALMWVADHYFNQGKPENLVQAEKAYQQVYNQLAKASLNVKYQALVMAGRSAMRLSKWDVARGYFWLILKGSAPANIKDQAAFALGDAAINDPRKGKKGLESAIDEFKKLVALPARGDGLNILRARCRIGDCHYLLAAQENRRWAMALDEYKAVRDLSANLPSDPPVRYRAILGMAMVLENRAPNPDKQKAVELYSEVFHGANSIEAGDPRWIRHSGLAAARLYRELNQHEAAIKIYERMKGKKMFSKMKPALDRLIADSQLKVRGKKE